ncbi:MAG: carbamoyl-phosphate synthase large subunit, partial [Chloroflexi bacterium]|nr:carbamoyl-phosphate synthase large subunit [Chloroflexota bacterium]
TQQTTAALEPTLDYLVIKIPRWPFDKFPFGERTVGTQMKATGEVMAIDRSFEAAFQKAVRSLEFGSKTILWADRNWGQDPEKYPFHPHDLRLWVALAALRRGMSPEGVSRRTGYDPWFVYHFLNIVKMEKRLLGEKMTPQLMWEAKRLGFSDDVIGTLADRLPEQVRELRRQWNLRPVYKMVDTCAAEFAAQTPYFYSTYEKENEAEPLPGSKALVIGSGPIRIGQGIEFDYCSVHAAWALQHMGAKSIMANSNPETVSTDFDTSDRLYFEPLDTESIRDILDNEAVGDQNSSPKSIVQFGGQTAINLAEPLAQAGLPIMGSSAETIDLAEDRRRFEGFMHQLGIPQPPGAGVTSIDEAVRIANTIGYPVLVRPSYVLGGRAMEIVHNVDDLLDYLGRAFEMDSKHPVLVDKYLEGKECEVDAVSDGEQVLIPGIMEHIERAGVHSGDSMAIYPGLNMTEEEVNTIVDYTTRLGKALQVKGLMNVQFVIMPSWGEALSASSVYVLEVNPRSSRTVPFISKVTGVPLVRLAIQVMMGKSLEDLGYESGLWKRQKLVAIKAPVFSMSKLTGVDTHLGPEMKSTGEVMGIDSTFEAALAKSLMAAGLSLPPQGNILLSIADKDKAEALPIIEKFFDCGYHLYATEGTADMIRKDGMAVKMVTKKLGEGHPNVVDMIRDGKVDGVVNTLSGGQAPFRDGFYIRRMAVEKRIPCFTSLDTARAAAEALSQGSQSYAVQPLKEYLTRRADVGRRD